jgi:hypothetical protein
VRLSFSGQFAVEHFWIQEHLNPEKMQEYVKHSVRDLLNDDLVCDSVSWESVRPVFTVTVKGTIPNALTTLSAKTYASASRLFPNLLPDDVDSTDVASAFYFPYPNRVSLDVGIDNGVSMSGPRQRSGKVQLILSYHLPAGPFNDDTRPDFRKALSAAVAEYTRSYISGGPTQP